MKTKTLNGVTTTYTYNNANELTNSGYAFDANGSETADPGVFSNAAYNTLDQTSSITPTGGSAYNLAYTGLGQARRITNGTTSQVNDQLGLNEDIGPTTTFFTRDASGLVIGERQAGSRYYFLHDALGSVVAATDAAGNVVTTYQYDPYGNPTATTGSLYEPIRYANGYWDASTTNHETLYKFGQRYYDPSVGRWTQEDPVDDPLDAHGWNGYDYADDDPINNIDPTGLLPWPGNACGFHEYVVRHRAQCGARLRSAGLDQAICKHTTAQ